MAFSGIIPATITTFHDDETLNLDAMAAVVEHQIGAGVDGLFICGSTGEWWLLNEQERKELAATVVDTAAGRVPVMVHIGANSTAESVCLAKHAEHIGADAISALPPTGRPYPAEAVWDHFRSIGAASALPLYLYHLPQVYGDIITIDRFVDAIDTIPTLAGAKFSSYQIDDLIDLKMKAGDQLNIISGCGEQLMSAIGAGADGSICTWWNLIPKLGQAVTERLEQSDVPGARELQHKIVAFGRAGLSHAIGFVKLYYQHTHGIQAGQCRRPLSPASDEQYQAYRQRVRELDIESYLI